MQWLEAIRKLTYRGFDIRPSAKNTEISQLENELGFVLPEDLRDFYTFANGIYGDNNGWSYQIIASTQDVVLNLKAIKMGYKEIVIDTDYIFRIKYPKVLKNFKIIPIDDANDGASGLGSFYYFDSNSDNSMIAQQGFYQFYAEIVKENTDPQITFQAANLDTYMENYFKLTLEGATP